MFDYPLLCNHIIDNGEIVDTRFGPTKAMQGLTVVFSAGERPQRPKINPRIGYHELVQLLAGTYDPVGLAAAAPNAQHQLFTEQMAYGPRAKASLPMVVDALKRDLYTRQAVVFIGHPWDGPTKNLPCTLTIQFLYRRRRLLTFVAMRSWDLIKGLPYDIIMFGGLAQAVAGVLDVEAGEVAVNAGDAHIYLEDADAGKLPRRSETRRFHVTLPTESWEAVRDEAYKHLDVSEWQANHPPFITEENPNERRTN